MSVVLDRVEIDDLPTDNLKQVAGVIGIAKLKELMVKCPGMILHIPKSFNSGFNHKYIEENFTGGNVPELARHLGITTRSVYRHIKAISRPK